MVLQASPRHKLIRSNNNDDVNRRGTALRPRRDQVRASRERGARTSQERFWNNISQIWNPNRQAYLGVMTVDIASNGTAQSLLA
jgi:hypothetical protein